MADIKPIFDQPPETRPLPTPTRDVPYSPLGFGAGVGAGMQDVAQAGATIYRKAADDAKATMVLSSVGTSLKAMNQIIADPVSGYASTKGQNALADRDKYVSKFQDALNGAMENITDDDAKRAFAPHLLEIWKQGMAHVVTHEAEQQEVLSRAAFQGTLDQKLQSMRNDIIGPLTPDVSKTLDEIRAYATAEGIRRFGNDSAAINSIVAPALGRAAYDGMQAALATGDPGRAQQAFNTLGSLLPLDHHRDFAAAVATLQRTQAVRGKAAAIVNAAMVPIMVPGGNPIVGVDATRLAQGLATLPAGDPGSADVQKLVESQQQVLDKVKSQTVAQVVARIETAGTDPATGAFSLSAPAVNPIDRTWLQRNAPDRLIALRALDARAQRIDTGEVRQISRGNYNDLTAEMIDPTLRKQKFAQMTPAEFQSYMLDDDRYPGGFTNQDKTRALQQFKGVKDAAAKLEEQIPNAVTEILKAALPDDPDTAKQYVGSLRDALQRFVDDYQATHKGVAPSSAEVREYGAQQMAQGKVEGTGFVFDDRVRLVKFRVTREYRTQIFRPFDENLPPVSLTGYRYNKDRTLRIPVYSDGSRGPTEPVP